MIAGKLSELKNELKKDPEAISHWYEDSTTLLIAACAYGNVESAKYLIAYDPSKVKFQVPVNGYTALMAAAMVGHLEVVELLLQNGAVVNVYSHYGITPLSAASRNGHIAIVETLLRNGADKDAVDNRGW